MPAITPEVDPEPEQLSTRTGTTVAAGATPYVPPATVPATWVPWPLQSLLPFPSEMELNPEVTRPAKSVWSGRTPVSMT